MLFVPLLTGRQMKFGPLNFTMLNSLSVCPNCEIDSEGSLVIYCQLARLEIVPKVRAKSANERQCDPWFIRLTTQHSTQQNLAQVDSDYKSLDYR